MAGTTHADSRQQMIALRRHSSCELLSITSTPLSQPPWFEGPEVELCIVAAEVDEGIAERGGSATGAMAVASMTRPRRAIHEEVWVQLFIDDAFVDLTRALDASDDHEGTDLATFLGRVEIPAIYFDGQEHRARVKFVNTVSRVVPRGTGAGPAVDEQEMTAETDFVATMGRPKRR